MVDPLSVGTLLLRWGPPVEEGPPAGATLMPVRSCRASPSRRWVGG